jgi:2-(1,2-epoxy-1,2-dihydrophenyl)acetyl-CoA isomerase
MAGDVLERRDDGDVVHLTLNRPERLNALSPELVRRLGEELFSISDDTRAVVLRGNGRAFSAGHDLKDAAQERDRDEADLRNSVERMQDITRALRACPAPVIGVVHGYAVGAGCEIALCCDLVVASDDAQLGFPETGVALIVTNGVTATLPRAVGQARAKELILLGEFITGQQAHHMGLVNRVVAPDELEATVDEWIARLRTRGALAVTLSKRLIDQGMAPSIESILDAESAASVEAEKSVDAAAAVRAFADRAAQ